jgi:hypothetical protein
METYFRIIQTICNSKTIVYPKNSSNFEDNQKYWKNFYDNESPNYELCDIYFFMNKIINYKPVISIYDFAKIKHKLIDEYRNQVFFKKNSEMLLENIYKTQRIYNGFALLANIYRSKCKIINNTDLILNPINKNDKNIISLYHENGVYLFTVKDLIHLINNALSNTDNYFALPLYIKNPYINKTFTISMLYSIFFKIKSLDCIMPTLFYRYFKCNFNNDIFVKENEFLIREKTIERDVYKQNESYLFNSIRNMIKYHFNNKRRISDDIDKTEFIRIMRPYYYLYLTSIYQIQGLSLTNNAMFIFRRRINELFEYNPKFGRIILKKNQDKSTFRKISDLDHPIFTMNQAKEMNELKEMNDNYNIDEPRDVSYNTHIRFNDDYDDYDGDDSVSSDESYS